MGRNFLQIKCDKTLISRIYEELMQLINNKNPIFKMGKGSEQTFLQQISNIIKANMQTDRTVE